MKKAYFNNRNINTSAVAIQSSEGVKSSYRLYLLMTGFAITLFVLSSLTLNATPGMKSLKAAEYPCLSGATAIKATKVESDLEIEAWMADTGYFSFSYSIEEAQESLLLIEEWMINTGYFEIPVLSCTKRDREMVIEKWMTDINYFRADHYSRMEI